MNAHFRACCIRGLIKSCRCIFLEFNIQSRSRRFALSVMHAMYGEDGVTLKVYSHYNVKRFYTYLKSTKVDVNRGNYSAPTKTTVTPATGK